MDDISIGIIELLLTFAAFIGALFLGRFAREKMCSFLPNEPASVSYALLLIASTIAAAHFDALSLLVILIIAASAVGYIVGYPMGDFSTRGIVEMSKDKEVILNAYKIAYYYDHKLKKHCIADYPGQTFLNKCRRTLLRIPETLDIPLEKMQSRVRITVDKIWYKASISGFMTYVKDKEIKSFDRGKKKVFHTHVKYTPTDITSQGPYDFFLKTELYLTALDIAYESNALKLEAEINGRKAAAEGGATIIQAIAKLDPADAAANLRELRAFVLSEEKTTEAAMAADEEKPADEDKKKRWWQSRRNR